MYGVINGAYFCNQERTQQLNDRIYDRNIPSRQIKQTFDPRPVKTRQLLYPSVDCYNQYENQQLNRTNNNETDNVYNQYSDFNPGSKAPYSGFAVNVDQESRLKDIFMAKQKWTPQTKYIPSSKSDLYNKTIREKPHKEEKHSLLFHSFYNHSETPTQMYSSNNYRIIEDTTHKKDNLDKLCHYGNQMFHNHTRQQIKDLSNK